MHNYSKRLDLKHPILHRIDAGNDSADTLEELRKGGKCLIVKRNLRQENKVKWLCHAMYKGVGGCPREGKEVYIGIVEHLKHGGVKSSQEPLTFIYSVTCYSIDKHELEVDTYWTNLGETSEDIIAFYHDHGTSEHYT